MNILIYGGGLLGMQVYYLLKTYLDETSRVLGFVDDFKEAGQPIEDGLHILGSLDEINSDPTYAPDRITFVLAIGYNDLPGRSGAFLRAKEMGYNFEKVIHPYSLVEKNSSMGEGTIVSAGVVVDQFVEIAEANYLDIGVLVGERCKIGPNNYFSAGTAIGGSVVIGQNNFLGISTTVVNDITIGNNNFVNAKTLVHKRVTDDQKVIELHEQYSLQRS